VYDRKNKYEPTGPPFVGRENEMPILFSIKKIKDKAIPIRGLRGS
jgi:hypothetical protein